MPSGSIAFARKQQMCGQPDEDSPMKIMPAVRSSHLPKSGRCAINAAMLPEANAIAPNTAMVWAAKTAPRASICSSSGPLAGCTNCGRNARKNKATLGLIALAMNPRTT